MKKIAWITDSTSSLDIESARESDIFVVPMGISFGKKTYKDGVDITDYEFYEMLDEYPELPKSSQPAIGDMVELYQELKLKYEMGIAIHVSSELSGTLQTSIQAAEIAGFPLEVIDSKALSLPMAELILIGKEMESNGFFPTVIVESLRKLTNNIELYVSVGSLEQLHKGGRVSSLQLKLGNLLKIHPVLRLENGKVVQHTQVRTKKNALKKMLAPLEYDISKDRQIDKVFILHANADEDAVFLEQSVQQIAPFVEIEVGVIASAIGVHTGNGTVAISWIKR